MISKDEIQKLANLARLEVSESELEKLGQELPEIITFVETIQKANPSSETITPELRNVLRADENAYEGGTFSETLLKAAPARKGDRVVVKQVITRKNN